ncbi:energy-coupling factor transporter transmembrane component T [Ruminococcus sp. HUN007]|uniref:energy-coupling factor transporter transmembrane component T family protein n=1 Tax=Ruminococcus sp. HUN007 TaxID=1514668 RepID=UPI0005D15B21|nr:energy-coupling factor transporter transmembrane component T [Ruminococcus sp. HUN007]
MKGFLDYKDGNSVFHRMNPLSKLILAVVLCAMCFVSSNIYFVAGVIVINLLIAFAAGIHKMALSILSGLSKLSVVLFIVQVLFVRTGNTLFTIPGLKLPITDDGVYFSLLFVLRLLATALPLAIMLSVTQMSDLANVMVSKLKIPYKYAFAVITVIRFIPVFASEMAGIIESQTARGVEFDTKNIFKKIGLIIPLCVPLLISSVKKIDSSAIAAELRGFNRRTAKSGYKKYPFGSNDIFAVLICAVVIAGGIMI